MRWFILSVEARKACSQVCVLEVTSFKFSNINSNNQTAVRLRCAYNHVLDKVPLSWGVRSNRIILVSLYFHRKMPMVILVSCFAFSLWLCQEPFPILAASFLNFFQGLFFQSYIWRSDGHQWWTHPNLYLMKILKWICSFSILVLI